MLEELRYFVLVVRHGTLTAAARQAHVTQPALTAAIQKLEQRVGARLLHRGAAGATLTAAGEVLLPRARAALAAVEDGVRAVSEVMGLEAGVVRLGGGATACTYYLPPLLAEFRRHHPAVRIQVREAHADSIYEALEAGELDLGIVFEEDGEYWCDDELVLVASPKTDLREAPFVTFAKGAATRTLLDRHFPGVAIAMELGSIAAVKENVRAGVGVALVSRRAIERNVAAGQLVLVPHKETPIVRPVSLVHRGEDRLPPAAAELRRMILAQRQPRTARPRRGKPAK